MATAPQATPQAPGSSPAGSAQPAQAMTPQQQQQMELIVKQCMRVLLEDAAAHTIVVKASKPGNNPAKVLAAIVAPLLAQIAATAKQAGAEPDTVTFMVAGVQVLGLLVEMLIVADVVEEANGPAVVADAAKRAVEMHNAALQGGGQPAAPQGQPPQAPPAGGGMLSQGAPA